MYMCNLTKYCQHCARHHKLTVTVFIYNILQTRDNNRALMYNAHVGPYTKVLATVMLIYVLAGILLFCFQIYH